MMDKPSDGWIEWGGGDYFIDPKSIVEVRYRDGVESIGHPRPAAALCWGHQGMDCDITHYRVVTP